MPEAAWLADDHRAFGQTVRKFLERDYEPHRARWTRERRVPHAFWEQAGALGILGASTPVEYGGSGLSRTFDLVTYLEQGRIGDTGWGIGVHNIVQHYLAAFATDGQKRAWLPRLASGGWVGAIAMTEPGAGSDLQSIRTTAIADGNEYVLNGQKTFISNAANADFLIVVAKTDPEAGARGISLIALETAGAEGFQRGRALDKLGMDRQDTMELFFQDLRIPRANLIGETEGRGFYQLMGQLPWERLVIGVCALAASRCALEITLDYVKNRRAFGQRLMDYQNTRFKLAEAKSESEIFSAFIDRLVEELEAGTLTPERAAMAKWWGSEMQGRIVDNCLQLHGGYGYMNEYRIAELYRDARVQRIYGGTNEIMRELIARSLDRT
ncbi:acyl-CoA dehydrogenase family protein [Bradyrhizobium sp. AUGA SZCCT0431]|uniref:acyl-CoA dehydrogenase family protein n=1 Tax=Bradyrhizobium sp. AUGA SZCCT0431 TaxID=2807674 RepID=UPI001BA9AB4E|nr:acyl-CoA dehydrogenase family protein [Bradyrhizobium sp. AUGA SZCCT0431]MBR1146176.1 acyl-CoA dehydrogenase family protein [Bradyrhizobium sp. AUGA SZCCT0431]